MSRGQYKAVTQVPILVPCSPEEQDGLATFLMEIGAPQPVRVVADVEFGHGSNKRNSAQSSLRGYELENFKAVLALIKSIPTQDKLAIATARTHATRALTLKRNRDRETGVMPAAEGDLAFGRSLIPLFGLGPGEERAAIERWSGYRHGPKADSDERWMLSQLMTEALKSVRVVLWWSGRRFEPAFYCPDLKSALHTFLLMKVTGGCVGVCLKCGKFFEQKRPDQNYCSIAHREAHRVARWRAARVLQSTYKKRGVKNVTRKTR